MIILSVLGLVLLTVVSEGKEGIKWIFVLFSSLIAFAGVTIDKTETSENVIVAV